MNLECILDPLHGLEYFHYFLVCISSKCHVLHSQPKPQRWQCIQVFISLVSILRLQCPSIPNLWQNLSFTLFFPPKYYWKRQKADPVQYNTTPCILEDKATFPLGIKLIPVPEDPLISFGQWFQTFLFTFLPPPQIFEKQCNPFTHF